jgi:hypothetical protein
MLAGITYFYQKIMMRFYQFVVLGLFIFLIGCRPSTESKTFVGVDIDMIYIEPAYRWITTGCGLRATKVKSG